VSEADAVRAALSEFVEHYLLSYPELETPFDPTWRSPCELGEPFRLGEDEIERIRWRPLPRDPATASADFEPLERALEQPVHEAIKAYYGAFFSGGLEAEAPDGHVSLILLWNAQDRERLIENLIGHALAKKRARSAFSVFFACTEPDSELFLSVCNDSGAVLLERPGDKPIRQVADRLADFIEELTPAPPELNPEHALLLR
jgi:SecY interacting protein Syd